MRVVIFTDLDGTLLDHDTYEWSQARPMLDRIREEGWPLVFVTSKTRAEVEGLRDAMDVDEPFVVENGAAAFYPACYDDLELPGAGRVGPFRAVVFGLPYSAVRDFVETVGHGLGVEGFGDMTVERVAELSGLSLEDARLAKRREFTEPCVLQDPKALARLRIEASARGLAVTEGGRFHHLIGDRQHKGHAVDHVSRMLAQRDGGPVVTIGLGDGPNDVPMLEAVDYPILITGPGRSLPRVVHERTRIAEQGGPNGWSSALAKLILEIERS